MLESCGSSVVADYKSQGALRTRPPPISDFPAYSLQVSGGVLLSQCNLTTKEEA